MALTHQDLDMLSKPFPAKVHKFLGGLPYLHEEPVGMRLDMVDPSWSWEIIKIERRANAGEGGKDVGTVVAHGRLTVGGVSRDGIGMATIQQTNPIEKEKWENGTKKKTGEWYTNEANEAEKSAATDAFKRAFRMFGGGRYLLTIPKDEKGKLTVQNITQLDKWLKANFGEIEDVPTFHDEDSAEDATPAGESFLPNNVTSGNFAPQTANTSAANEKVTAVITTVDVRLNAKTQSRHIVAGGVTFFGRDVFRALGYDNPTIERLDKVGAVNLPDGIQIVYTVTEENFKHPLRVKRIGTGEVIAMADLKQKASGE